MSNSKYPPSAELDLRLEDQSAMLARVASGFGHAVSTPLNVILAHSEILSDDGSSPEDVHRAAASIRRQVTVLRELLEQLREFSRLDDIHRQTRAPAEVVFAARDRLRPMAEARGIELTVSAEDGAHEPVPLPTGAMLQVLTLLGGISVRDRPEGSALAWRVSSPERRAVRVTQPGLLDQPADLDSLREPWRTPDLGAPDRVRAVAVAAEILRSVDGNLTADSGATVTSWFTAEHG